MAEDPADSKVAYEPPEEQRPASAAPTEPELEIQLPTVAALDYSPPPPRHDPYAALRLPVYRLFAANHWLAVIGSQLFSVSVGWEVYRQTRSDLALGFVGGIQALPVILLALPAGHVADVYSRKRVLMATQALLVVCAVALAWLWAPGADQAHALTMTYGIVLINAIALTFARPARQSLLPQLVSGGVFSNAVTWNSSIFEVASMVGPALGGLLIARWNVSAAFALSGLCTAICFFLTWALPRVPPAGARGPFSCETLVAGVRFVWRSRLMLAVMTLDMFAVLLGGATFLLPVFAIDILQVGSVGFGWMRAAPALGAAIMAMIIAHSPPMKRAGRALLIAVAGFGAATIVFGLSDSLWLSLGMLFLVGALDNISVVIRHTLVQLLTPDHMRGRVSAVNQVFIGSSNELGGLRAGAMAAWLGPVTSVVIGGIGTILVVVGIGLKWPEVRRFGSLQHAKPI